MIMATNNIRDYKLVGSCAEARIEAVKIAVNGLLQREVVYNAIPTCRSGLLNLMAVLTCEEIEKISRSSVLFDTLYGKIS